MQTNTTTKAYKIFALSMTLMATSDAISSFLVREVLSSPLLNVVRFSFFALFSLVYALQESSFREILEVKNKKILFLRGLFQSFAAIFYFSAFKYIPYSIAASIFFCAPIAILALSPFILGEKVSIRQWFTVFLGFLGMIFIINPLSIDFSSIESLTSMYGFGFALGAMLFFMLVQLLTRKMSGQASTASILFYGNLISIVNSFICSFFYENNINAITLTNSSIILIMITFGFLAQVLFVLPYKYARASDLAPLNYFQLAVTVIIGIVFIGERPDFYACIGMLLIFVAGTVQGILTKKGL